MSEVDNEQATRVRKEALELLRGAEVFFAVTVREGRIEFRALVPERYPVGVLNQFLGDVRKGLRQVEEHARRQAGRATILAPPAGFNPRKLN